MEPEIPSPADAPPEKPETAPPLWPLHAFVRGDDEPDPFDVLRQDPELDGTYGAGETGSPAGRPAAGPNPQRGSLG